VEKIILSQIARNPVIAAFFARGERDNGSATAVQAPKGPVLVGGRAA
jgi:hypothetical protein